MRTMLVTMCCLAALFATPVAVAIDRDANMIDTVWIDGTSFSDSESYGIRVSGETSVKDTGGEWALLAAISRGVLTPDGMGDFDSTSLALGVKHYLFSPTSISLLGSYTWHDGSSDFDIASIKASFKQRLLPATDPISPYLRGEASVQFVDEDDSSYEVLVLSAIAGCDFMMTDTMAVVFEGGISESEDIDDGSDREDGWLVSIGMQYYWE
jgi:hypothetical protein